MKLPFLASFIVLILLVAYENRKHSKQEANSRQTFWEKEAAANATRRQSLENLSYIQIPFDKLPMELLTDNEKAAECHRLLHALSEQKIVNLTGINNTDLKLKYGAANLPELMEYDQNYTLLARTLQDWADILYAEKEPAAAAAVLEFAILTMTDVRKSYSMLAEIYQANGETHKIADLLETAGQLHSLNRPVIVRTLQEFGPYND